MLSATEMADRKKARKALEAKRLALEEAVERAVCEKVYEKIWRHRSTDDEERDHKLRSRTAALSLVGIGLQELLMTGEQLTEEERQKAKEKEPEIREYLSAAREDLLRMNDEKYPLVDHVTGLWKPNVWHRRSQPQLRLASCRARYWRLPHACNAERGKPVLWQHPAEYGPDWWSRANACEATRRHNPVSPRGPSEVAASSR